MFLRTKSNELITIVAVLRGSGVQVELAKDYSIAALARSLDPARASR